MVPRLLSLLLLFSLVIACQRDVPETSSTDSGRPTVSFTFDDGMIRDIEHYKFKDWNQRILHSLAEAETKAMFFVTGFNKMGFRGKFLLQSWNDQGHAIANHTFSHPNFNDKNNTPDIFKTELLQTDTIIQQYTQAVKFFRFPYLKEGKTRGKIDSIRTILQAENYRNGYVTIDASDWYVSSRLIKKIRSDEPVDTLKFQEFYINHILDRAKFYEALSFKMHDRHIPHTLLLHHNLTSALFLKPLIKRFKSEGWEVVDAAEAYQDSIYQKQPQIVPAGESLIWSLAKETGKFEDQLRYPAEDSRYEKDKMDQLGL